MPYRRKSQQAEREYEKIKSQLEGLEESVRDRCKKEFTGGAPSGRQIHRLPFSGSLDLLGQKLQEATAKHSTGRWPRMPHPGLHSPSQT